MRKDSDNEPSNELVLDNSEDEDDTDPTLMTGDELSLNLDGHQSQTPGPCRCGHKHWCDGKEYDHVFNWETSEGIKMLGYNLEDNAYDVAQAFIAKHELNKNSLDDKPLVNLIADQIMKHTAAKTSESAKKKLEEKKTNFNPYKSQYNVPAFGTSYNKVKQKFETTTYLSKDKQDALKREQAKRTELANKQKELVKSEQEDTQNRNKEIKERINNDKIERAARKDVPAAQSPLKKVNQNTVPVMKGGILTYVDKSKVKKKNIEEEKLRTLRDINHQNDDSDSDSDHEHLSIDTLEPDEKEEWTVPVVVMKLGVQDSEQEEPDMKHPHLSPQNIDTQILRIGPKMIIMKQDEVRKRRIILEQPEEPQLMSTKDKFPGSGKALAPQTSPIQSTPDTSTATTITTTSTTTNTVPDNNAPLPRQPRLIEVSADQPSTTIQVVLHNGKKNTC